MGNSNPFELNVQVLLHPAHQVAREARQVEALSEFRRDDDLPQARILGRLPAFHVANTSIPCCF